MTAEAEAELRTERCSSEFEKGGRAPLSAPHSLSVECRCACFRLRASLCSAGGGAGRAERSGEGGGVDKDRSDRSKDRSAASNGEGRERPFLALGSVSPPKRDEQTRGQKANSRTARKASRAWYMYGHNRGVSVASVRDRLSLKFSKTRLAPTRSRAGRGHAPALVWLCYLQLHQRKDLPTVG